MKSLIFLPGLGCGYQLFAHQIGSLKQYTSKVIMCNSFNNMNDHAQYVLDEAPNEFILVGHSFGGWIAQWVAIQAPKRVTKLILLGTGTGRLTMELSVVFNDMLKNFEQNQARDFFEKIWPLTVYADRVNDKKLKLIVETMQDQFCVEELINQVKTDLEGKETTNELNKIQCTTLLIHGKQDPFYREEMYILRKRIPNNQFIEIDNCGHMIPLEKPETVTALIERWLDKR